MRALGVWVIAMLVMGCDKFPGWRSTAPTSSAPPGASSEPPTSTKDAPALSATAAVPGAVPPPAGLLADGGLPPPSPERVVLRAGYITDDQASSVINVDRGGVYKLEQRGTTAEAKIATTTCAGTLPADSTAALWKSIDGAAFAPSEAGFSKAVQAPRLQNDQQARYSVIRMVDDLSMVPSDENGAKALVAPVRTAIATIEKLSASSGNCTRR